MKLNTSPEREIISSETVTSRSISQIPSINSFLSSVFSKTPEKLSTKSKYLRSVKRLGSISDEPLHSTGLTSPPITVSMDGTYIWSEERAITAPGPEASPLT